MQYRATLIVCLAVVCAGLASAAEFETERATDAQEGYRAQMDRIENEYQRDVQRVEKRYRNLLTTAKRLAERDGKTTEAERIQTVLDQLKAKQAARQPDMFATYNGHAYRVVPLDVSWHRAHELCRAFGGHLVTLSDEDEQQFVTELVGSRIAWVGATDDDSEGDWQWVDDTSTDNMGWAGGEPNNGNRIGPENFAAINFKNGGRLWDAKETHHKVTVFVCEWDD